MDIYTISPLTKELSLFTHDRGRCPGFYRDRGIQRSSRFVMIEGDEDDASELEQDVNYFSTAIGVVHGFTVIEGDKDDVTAPT